MYVTIQDEVKVIVKKEWVVGSQMLLFKHKAYWVIAHSPHMVAGNVLGRYVVDI